MVLLSTARPTSPASDKGGGGRSGVQRTPSFGAESERSDLTKIQLLSKLSPKEFAKKFVSVLPITKQKANRQRDFTSLHIHTEKRSGRATPEFVPLSPLASSYA